MRWATSPILSPVARGWSSVRPLALISAATHKTTAKNRLYEATVFNERPHQCLPGSRDQGSITASILRAGVRGFAANSAATREILMRSATTPYRGPLRPRQFENHNCDDPAIGGLLLCRLFVLHPRRVAPTGSCDSGPWQLFGFPLFILFSRERIPPATLCCPDPRTLPPLSNRRS